MSRSRVGTLVAGAAGIPAGRDARRDRAGGGGTTAATAGRGPDTYVQSVKLDNRQLRKSWLPESFLQRGGTVRFTLGPAADTTWATGPPTYRKISSA